MANVYKPDNSPYFYYRFTHNGKEENRSTKKKNYNSAVKVMNDRISELRASGGYNDLYNRMIAKINELPEEERMAVKQKLANKLLKNTSSLLPVSEAFKTYSTKPKKRNPSVDQLKRYRSYFNHFSTWLSHEFPNIEYVNEINHQVVDKYMTELWAGNISENTYNKHLTFFRSMFNAISINAGLNENVWKKIDKLHLNSHHKEALTLQQFSDVVNLSEGEMRTLLLIGFYTGLRLGDCCSLSWDNIDLNTNVISLNSSKTKAAINICIHPMLMNLLINIEKSTNSYVLPEIQKLYSSGPTKITNKVKYLFQLAGIETTEEREQGRRSIVKYGFHSLRHTFVSALHSAGVPQMVVEAIVGHNTKAVNDMYKHVKITQIEEAINKLPEIRNEK